jgi:hypothetical protein
VPTFADSVATWSAWHLYGRILGFLDQSRYFFFQVPPQLYSRGWVDPVPDHFSENLVAPGIEPRTLTTRPQRRSGQTNIFKIFDMGQAVEGRGFESRWRQWILSIYLILPDALSPGTYSSSNRNEYQESSREVKRGRSVRLHNLTAASRLSRQCGIINISQPYRPPRHTTGTKKKLCGLSPRANYTDRATAVCRRSKCQLLRIESVAWSTEDLWPRSSVYLLRFLFPQ